jgi:hypothetical protein
VCVRVQSKLLVPFALAPPTSRPSTGAPKRMTPAPPSAAFEGQPAALSIGVERRTATGVVTREFKAPDDTQVSVCERERERERERTGWAHTGGRATACCSSLHLSGNLRLG